MVSGQHLQRFNTSLYSCQGCRVVCPIRTYPCRCHQYRLGEPKESRESEASNELRTSWKRQGLSKMAQRMLLLGPQVPMGRYTITTYIALNDWYSTVNIVYPISHMASALCRNIFAPDVPDHRVVASNAGLGRVIDWRNHGEEWKV